MLRVDGCRLTWPDFVADYTLDVEAGSLCAVVGPSGGGKTTLLHMIAGFEEPETGSLSWEGRSLRGVDPARRPVSMVFQDHNLFPHLTAAQNVGLGLRPALRLKPEEQALVSTTLASVGLEGIEQRRPGEMSGGQRQRVALARVLVSRRPLLLLDEPFGGLDPGLRKDMVQLVDGLRRERGLTVLMTIHTPEDVAEVADRMAFVADGRVIAAGSPHDVLGSADPRIVSFRG
jgi:thiamine transport system ATP-binding protein